VYISSTGPPTIPATATAAKNQQQQGEGAVNEEQGKGAVKSEKELPENEKREVEKLKQRDREVRQHEQAHMAAGAGLTGGANYSYQVGPDGKRYAIGGEVSIDVSSEKDPQATIIKMGRVKRAALAPADPSGADRAVARKADANIRAAQTELQKERTKESGDSLPGAKDAAAEDETKETGETPPRGSLIDISV